MELMVIQLATMSNVPSATEAITLSGDTELLTTVMLYVNPSRPERIWSVIVKTKKARGDGGTVVTERTGKGPGGARVVRHVRSRLCAAGHDRENLDVSRVGVHTTVCIPGQFRELRNLSSTAITLSVHNVHRKMMRHGGTTVTTSESDAL